MPVIRSIISIYLTLKMAPILFKAVFIWSMYPPYDESTMMELESHYPLEVKRLRDDIERWKSRLK